MSDYLDTIEYLSDEAIEAQAATDLLKYKKAIGREPVFPLYPEEMIEKVWDVKVEYADGLVDSSETSVLASYYPDLKKVLVNVKENENKGRCSFSIAHEMGHISLHSFVYTLTKQKKGKPGCAFSGVGNSPEKIERQADKYAAALLMPREEIHFFLQRLGCELTSPIDMNIHADTLKKHFRVSNEALEYRFRDLGFTVKNGYYVLTRKKLKEAMFISDAEREKWHSRA